jgi:hypothetical protein
MGLSTVRQIILKVATDSEFRSRFVNETDDVLSRFSLTDEEKQILKEKANGGAIDLLVKDIQDIQSDVSYTASDIRL